MLFHEHLLTRDFQGDQHFFRRDGSIAAYPTMPSAAHASDLRDPVTQLVPHEDAPAFSDIATTATPAATSALTTFSPPTPRPSFSLPEKKPTADRSREAGKLVPTTDSLTTQVGPHDNNNKNNPAVSSPRTRPQSFPPEESPASFSIRTEKEERKETAPKNKSSPDDFISATVFGSTLVKSTATTITTMHTSGRHVGFSSHFQRYSSPHFPIVF